MKKVIVFFLVLALCVTGVFAAGGRDRAGQPIVVQIGLENHPGEPTTDAIYYWANLIGQMSGGAIEAQVFPSSQMGTKDQIIDQMLAGMAVITLADGAFFADRGAPDMGITMGPFFFGNWEEAWNMVESNWWAQQARVLEGRGLKILASNWKYGERHTLTTRPIRTVADFRGLKLRVPTNNIQIRGTEVLGASPTPLPLGEVYTALQQGVVDGVENPLAVLWGGRFHEIAKHLTLTSHIRLITSWFTGTIWFNSLSREHQEIMVESARRAGLHNNMLVDRAEAALLDDFRREGVEIINIDIAALQRQAEPFYSLPEFRNIWSAGIIEATTRARAGLDRVR